MEKSNHCLENIHTCGHSARPSGIEADIIGVAPITQQLREQVIGVSSFDVNTVIFGETGVGKELVARCLHKFSARARGPFVAINCGAIPENLLESELFGHEKGAFTGAEKRRIGKLEHADKGVLFLDEIESMPVNFQVKLLRALQEKTIERLGSNISVKIDPRVICATKVDLKELTEKGRFRTDLYYRLNVIDIQIAPLRQRTSDIALLFEHFLEEAEARYGITVRRPGAQELALLNQYHWPGNIRELKNVAHRFAIESTINNGKIDAALAYGVDAEHDLSTASGATLLDRVRRYERELIVGAMQRHKGRILSVMEELRVNRRTLNIKMQQYQIKREDFLVKQK